MLTQIVKDKGLFLSQTTQVLAKYSNWTQTLILICVWYIMIFQQLPLKMEFSLFVEFVCLLALIVMDKRGVKGPFMESDWTGYIHH